MGEARYMDRKEAIRAVLKYCAIQRQTVRYGVLGKAVGIPAQGPWQPVLDEIAKEENPDITFLVVNKDGLSSRIGFEAANPPTDKQRKGAERTIQAVFTHYAK
ncbi:hypothetical protein [Mesorhizobium sp. B2-6-2]|uniref:hypothetical protein n=1 Tax=Mesorhizobium sp. B2-6-2 TaxID=2589915 RepID=UPI001128E6BD|nr:hypothetical protein [Mesorhizobium sp. B2-6-2]TPJ70729.1 hypothetical protein FJ419_29280 [Mesorhizobium sp. B2-6-2]